MSMASQESVECSMHDCKVRFKLSVLPTWVGDGEVCAFASDAKQSSRTCPVDQLWGSGPPGMKQTLEHDGFSSVESWQVTDYSAIWYECTMRAGVSVTWANL